ncbi:MAG: hypothetical protein EOM92_11170 [Gammaproteobacteria bacterium]|nr:hypothetical protein [Gammaproteobacteria bacterium]
MNQVVHPPTGHPSVTGPARDFADAVCIRLAASPRPCHEELVLASERLFGAELLAARIGDDEARQILSLAGDELGRLARTLSQQDCRRALANLRRTLAKEGNHGAQG